MIVPPAVLCAMVAAPPATSPNLDATSDAQVAPSQARTSLPANLVADMAVPGSDSAPWDYTFEPWPPCSFG